MLKLKNEKGFSLVEILVSLAIFTTVITISVGALLVLIDANAKAQTLKTSMDNLSFALDTMTRNIRTGDEYHCENNPSSLPGGIDDCPSPNPRNGLIYTDGETNERIGYRLSNNRIERNINSAGWLPLTAPEVIVQELEFAVTGTTVTNDESQPTVSIWIAGEVGDFDGTKSGFEIQTTVVQRILDL